MRQQWEGCFGAVFWLLGLLRWNSASSQIIQYISRMGACLVVNHPSDNDKSTLPSPTAYRAEIQAQLSEKQQPVLSSKKIRERSLENSASLQSKSILKTQSRSQIGSKPLDSNRSLQLEAMDSGPRTVKQVVITKEKPAPSLKELPEQRIVERDQDQEEQEEEGGSEESNAERQPQMESPANRLLEPDGNMLNKGLTDTDNRMIALTMAAKQPLKLNAIKLINGSIYNGEWLQGKRHGRGTLMWEDGSRYEGEWRNNFSWGQGKLIYNEHEQYQGFFVRNCREGYGRYINFGVEYVGEWRNDRRQGHGVETWGNGQHFQGEWVGGYKNGPGELHFQDGSYYKGEFSGNQLHGHGIYCWMNSRTYEGEWQHNRMSGLGVMTWANGERYQGQFKNDKMHGLGSLTHADKSISTGVFQQGRKHGIFTEVDPQGNAKQIQYYMGRRVRGEEGGRSGKSNNHSYTLSTVTVTNSF